MAVTSGTAVKAGDIICQLDTNNEERALEQIALAQALLALEDLSLDESAPVKVPPSPEEVKSSQNVGLAAGDQYNFPDAHPLGLRMTVLEIAKRNAQAYLDFAIDKRAAALLDEQNNGQGVGAFFSPTIKAEMKAQDTQHAAAVATATAELLRANIASARFGLAVTQLQKKHDLVKSQLAKEHDRITAEKARLTITAPVAGKVLLATTTGCFVKLGNLIAEITV